MTKAFGRLVWGETFYSVVSLYTDHQHGLLRSSKARQFKLLHIRRKKTLQNKGKRLGPPSQKAEHKLQQALLHLIESVVTLFSD